MKQLPPHRGSYSVGSLDVEVAIDPHQGESEAFGTALHSSTSKPALRLDTVLFTIFYPCESPSSSYETAASSALGGCLPFKRRQRGTATADRPLWLERPLRETGQAFAHMLPGAPSWMMRSLVWTLGRKVKVAAAAGAPPLSPPSRSASPNDHTDAAEQNEDSKWPVVIFSHGLSGDRHAYSHFCGELASRGFVVVAIEHRDGTAPVTRVLARAGDQESSERDVTSNIERKVVYTRQDDLRYDEEEKPPFMDFRKDELLMRHAEVSHVVSILDRVATSSAFAGELAKLNRRRGLEGANGGVDVLAKLTGRLDVSRTGFSLTGHSFGAATVLQVIRAGDELAERFGRVVCLDPWMEPLAETLDASQTDSETGPDDEVATVLSAAGENSARPQRRDGRVSPSSSSTVHGNGDSSVDGHCQDRSKGKYQDRSKGKYRTPRKLSRGLVPVPLLVINSEAFTLWDSHFKLVQKLVERQAQAHCSWLATMAGSVHLSFSDYALLLPRAMRVGGERVEPCETLNTFVDFTADVLRLNSPSEQRDGGGGERRALLLIEEKGEKVERPLRKGEKKKMTPAGQVRLHYTPG